jgi:hypothetical protein
MLNSAAKASANAAASRSGKSVFIRLPCDTLLLMRTSPAPFFPRLPSANHGALRILKNPNVARLHDGEKVERSQPVSLAGRRRDEAKKEVPMMRIAIRALALAGACSGFALCGTSVATAQSKFDGVWSVVVITRSGPCDQSYRYGLNISNGHVSYAGGGPVSVSGRVASNGSVSVTVSAGGQSASGSGKLSGNHGSGSWRGANQSGACSGTWQASRGG